MSLLSALEILELIEQGVIENVREGAINYRADINATSIDIHLGNDFLLEEPDVPEFNIIDLSKRERPLMSEAINSVILKPGQFCLGNSIEVFHLPDNISAQYMLKSSHARAGLEHSLAGWCDASWHNSTLTLELKNNLEYHQLKLVSGMPIGQMIFFRHKIVPKEFLYRNKGRYNNDETVKQLKD
ncbi:MAG: dCTP deaminase [uncultured bacterium]|nr:MAG: dCTP deaminase [uncultured bacterium]